MTELKDRLNRTCYCGDPATHLDGRETETGVEIGAFCDFHDLTTREARHAK